MRILVMFGLTLLLVACGAPTPTPAITLRMTPAVTVVAETATDTPEPTATSTFIPQCPTAPRGRLILQERGRVVDDDDALNLRAGPGTNFRILVRLEPGEVFFVLGGPHCNATFSWYLVRFEGFDGWIAEGDFEKYYVEPYLPG